MFRRRVMFALSVIFTLFLFVLSGCSDMTADFSDGNPLSAGELNNWKDERTTNLLPISDSTFNYLTSTYNIGSATYQWKDAYFSNDLIINTSAFFVDGSASNVGIGTATPREDLDVANGTVYLSTDGVTNGIINTPESMYINIDSDSNSSAERFAIATNRTAETGGSTLFTVLDGGNVGIGTTAPDSLVQINGRLSVLENDDDVITNIATGYAANQHVLSRGGYLSYRATNTDAFFVAGIGMTNPNNSSTGGGAGAKLIAYVGAEIETTDSNAGQDSGGHLVFHTKAEAAAPSEKMRLTSAGNLGIGTTVPGYELDVNGDLSATNITGTLATAAQTNVTSLGTLSSLAISGDLTVDTTTFKVDSSGNNVGIGTASPATLLHMNNETDGADTVLRLQADNASNIDKTVNLTWDPDDEILKIDQESYVTGNFGLSGVFSADGQYEADVQGIMVVTNNVTYNMTLNYTEVYDDYDMHSTVTNNERVYALKQGTYLAVVSIQWPSNSSGYRYVKLTANQSGSLAGFVDRRVPVSGKDTNQTLTGIFKITADSNYVFAQVFQNSGSNLTIVCHLAMVRLY